MADNDSRLIDYNDCIVELGPSLIEDVNEISNMKYLINQDTGQKYIRITNEDKSTITRNVY